MTNLHSLEIEIVKDKIVGLADVERHLLNVFITAIGMAERCPHFTYQVLEDEDEPEPEFRCIGIALYEAGYHVVDIYCSNDVNGITGEYCIDYPDQNREQENLHLIEAIFKVIDYSKQGN